MKVLFVSRSNSGFPHAFVSEQANAIERGYNIRIKHFLIRKGGFAGYLKGIIGLNKILKKESFHIVHVHYGLWTMVAIINKIIFFKKFKIVVTYHGSDIFKRSERLVSTLSSHLVSWNIPVTERMLKYLPANTSVIPCGIDILLWNVGSRPAVRTAHGWNDNDFVILFSSSFDRKVKDPAFAFKVVEKLKSTINKNVLLVELKGFRREQVSKLMLAADVLLMCSLSEGSPQVIKEAIINGLPVVSNDVGDVKTICLGIDNTFIIPKDVHAFVSTLQEISSHYSRVENQVTLIEKFDNRRIAEKVFSVYSSVLNASSLYGSEFSIPLSYEVREKLSS
jgi:glycosyltransferase involved in cell wall biosynthesis